MQQTIQQLNPRHFKILELFLRGWTVKQVAEHLAMSTQQVSIVKNSPSFQHEMAVRRGKLDEMVDTNITEATDEVTKEIQKGARDAVRRLVGHVGSPDAAISLKASTEVLDRAGYPRTQRIEAKSLSVVINTSDAKLIDETLRMDRQQNA